MFKVGEWIFDMFRLCAVCSKSEICYIKEIAEKTPEHIACLHLSSFFHLI